MTYLTCGARWCKECPHQWAEGIRCEESDRILDDAARYEREAQAALDAYDVCHPEDFLSFLTSLPENRQPEEEQ